MQFIFFETRQRLLVVNLNDQSDVSDLLGGFKPVNLRMACEPLMNEFGRLLALTFQSEGQSSFVLQLKQLFREEKWSEIANFQRKVCESILQSALNRKLSPKRRNRWKKFAEDVDIFQKQVESSGAFTFVEGILSFQIDTFYFFNFEEAW